MTRTAKKKHESGLRELIDKYVATASAATFNYKQVAAAIGEHNKAHHRAIALYLAELAFDGVLLEVSPGRFKPVQRNVVATGTFVRRSNGKNSVVTDDDGETIFIAERNSMHALNGDRVAISVAAKIKGRETEAKVTEIIERKEQTFIGTLRVDRHVGTLVTDSKFLATDIMIPRNRLRGGRTGDKAVVRITEWPENSQIPYGEVVDVLGVTGENNTEMHAILAEYGLPYKYPAAVEKAADKIDAGITPEVVAQREDLRGTVTFTIDPRDAKDFDDALSIRRLPDGNYEVGVHIADVTHYVKPDSIIDREARSRATSVYLVDRTVPMLPERLSNGICSLRPDEDKLTFSVIFKMDDRARVLDSRIVRTVT
ncbi:MAG: RNB domain-containing ribonuclease, partial [Muribaculaceae bacterium]|nr:RNB domain-containing ribonuclease [Muribaculaceae bacterium]